MRLLSLPEHKCRDYDPVSPAMGRALAATGLVKSALSLDGRLRLTARSIVGVTRVRNGVEEVELRVTPKMAVNRLLWLLGYARDPSGWRTEPVGLAVEHDLVPAMAIAFAAATSKALAHGVLQGYRTTEEALPLLRGRLREADQLRRRLGLALPLEVRYDDYTTDIPENQILASAVRRLYRVPGFPVTTRQALHRIDKALADVTPLAAGASVAKVPTNRLNERYQPALRLAQLILAGSSVEQPPGGFDAIGFAFDLNKVFEDWLTAAIREAVVTAHGGSIKGQHSMHVDEDGHLVSRPDITWWKGGRCVAVVDAKYKALNGTSPPNDDIYQMLAYCTALKLSDGHLVYGSMEQAPTQFRLAGGGVRISVHAINVSAPMAALREQIALIGNAVVSMGSMARSTPW